MSDSEYAKSGEVGCSFFILLGLIFLIVWIIGTVDEHRNSDNCKFEHNVAVAIHNGHIITDDCKVIVH